MNEKMRKWKGMEDSKSKRSAHHVIDDHEMTSTSET